MTYMAVHIMLHVISLSILAATLQKGTPHVQNVLNTKERMKVFVFMGHTFIFNVRSKPLKKLPNLLFHFLLIAMKWSTMYCRRLLTMSQSVSLMGPQSSMIMLSGMLRRRNRISSRSFSYMYIRAEKSYGGN